MVAFGCREDIIELTSAWKGDRFADGRPRVSDEIIQRFRALNIVTEEAWSVLWHHGYERQFEGNWVNLQARADHGRPRRHGDLCSSSPGPA